VKSELTISAAPIHEQELLSKRESSASGMGAVISFSGVVRGTEGEQAIAGLEYEAFGKMAEHQFHLIFNEIEKRWPVYSVRVTHRLGFVKAGETSLWVEVTAPHRGEAFAACQWLIEEMKRVVPIWKEPVPIEKNPA
jgi:molybdopterin synthase catalytic subunit